MNKPISFFLDATDAKSVTAAESERVPERVMTMLAELRCAIEAAGKCLVELDETLAPVLRSPVPEPIAACSQPDGDPPALSEIRWATDRVRELSYRIDSLRQRAAV